MPTVIFNPSFQQLEAYASSERLARYSDMAGSDPTRAAQLYLDNLKACADFYLLMHWLEVGLRNAVNRQLIKTHGAEWYDTLRDAFQEKQAQQIAEAQERLVAQGKPTNNPDIVAAIGFGFWANLFNRHYDSLWRYPLRQAFRHDAGKIKRSYANDILQKTLNLRNRIAHYEPIIHLPLEDRRQDILRVIGWIDPVLLTGISDGKLSWHD